MLFMATALGAVPWRDRKSRQNIGSATLRVRSLYQAIMVTLAPLSAVHDSNRLPCDGGRATARTWTRRAVVSCSTDSIVPRSSTIATRKTRVSEMRLPSRTSYSFDAKGRWCRSSLQVGAGMWRDIARMRMLP